MHDYSLTGNNDTVELTDALGREGNDDDQMSRLSLTMAWQGMSGTIFWVYTAAILAVTYGTKDALIGMVCAIVFFSVVSAILARYAIENRTTVSEFSRTILGVKGSIIVSVILALVAVYYAVFEGQIVAYAFQATFGGKMWAWTLVVVLYSTPLILGGARKFMDKLNGWLWPVYFGGLVTAVIWAGIVYGFSDAWFEYTPERPAVFVTGGPGWLASFIAYVGVSVLFMYVMDFAALGKRKDMKFHLGMNFGPVFYILGYGVNAFLGILITFLIPGTEASGMGVAGGIMSLMGIFGLIVIVATQTRPNAINYYVAAANFQAFGERLLGIKVPAFVWVIFSSVVIYLLMILPVTQYVLLALAWQGVLCSGWVAIALVHILLVRKQDEEHASIEDHRYRPFNAAGMTAWTVSTVLGIGTLQLGLIDPDLHGFATTWGTIVTLVTAALVYGVLWSSRLKRTALIS